MSVLCAYDALRYTRFLMAFVPVKIQKMFEFHNIRAE